MSDREDKTSNQEFTSALNNTFPENWQKVNLGKIAKIKYGKAKPKNNGSIPVIGSGGIYASTSISFVNFPTLVIGRKGTAGSIWLCNKQCYPSDTTFYLEWKEEIDIFFLYNYMLFNPLSGEHAKTTLPSLQKPDLEKYLIPLPPLQEQKKIAGVLGAVQEAKEKTEAVLKAAKELKKSMMKHLFTYGPVSIEEAEKVKLKETEIGLIPEDWHIEALGNIAFFKNGINFSREQKGEIGVLTIDVLNMYGENIYIKLNNLYRINKKVSNEYILKNGDILFVRSSLKREGVGWTSLFKEINEPVTYCGFVIRCRLKEDHKYNHEFLTHYFRTDIARMNLIASSGKVAITNINQGMLSKIKVPLPSLPTQQKIADILSSLDQKIQAEENKKKALEQLFKTLLNNLMTGKIRVHNLDIEI